LLPVVLAAGLILRLLYIRAIRDDALSKVLAVDARFYDGWARSILRGDWLGREVFYQDPLYAYFLALCYKLFGAQADSARIVQAFLDTGTLGLLYGIGALSFGSWAGLAAAGLAACYGPLVYYTGLLDKTTFSIFLIALSLALFGLACRRGAFWSALAGVGAGLAALARGNMLIAALGLGAWLFWPGAQAKGRLRRGLLFALGASCVIGAVALRNSLVGKDLVLVSANAGLNFRIGNNPYSVGAYMEPPFLHGIPESEFPASKEYAERSVGLGPMKASAVSAFYLRQGLQFIQDQPGAWLRLAARKLFLAANGLEIGETYSYDYFAERYALLRWAFLDFRLLFALGLLGACVFWARAGLHELHVFLLAYGLSLIVFFVTSRYRLPLIIPLALFGAWYLAEYLPKCLAHKARSWTHLGLAVVLLLLSGWIPAWVEQRVVKPTRATPHAVAGYIYCQELGDCNAGLRELETAKRIHPGAPGIEIHMAQCCDKMGDTAQALLHYTAAIEADPSAHEAFNNLGVIYFTRQDYRQARDAFAAALRLKPGFPLYQSNVARAQAFLARGQGRR
jgi:tetratricopeptide (TPR) repeat protein